MFFFICVNKHKTGLLYCSLIKGCADNKVKNAYTYVCICTHISVCTKCMCASTPTLAHSRSLQHSRGGAPNTTHTSGACRGSLTHLSLLALPALELPLSHVGAHWSSLSRSPGLSGMCSRHRTHTGRLLWGCSLHSRSGSLLAGQLWPPVPMYRVEGPASMLRVDFREPTP